MTPLLQAVRLTLPGRLGETSLSLDAGELVCLVGPNGSGKTSLLHAIAGVGSPGGVATIGGVEPRTLAPAQRQHLFSYLPASRDINWPLTAADLIALGLPDGGDSVAIDRVIADLELGAFRDRRVDQLSTGERSRVLIARALVARPKLLLLDEPAANLDPLWQLRLIDYLRDVSRRHGQAMLVALHDLELARYADRLIVMHRGRIAAEGAPGPLLEGPVIRDVFGIERVEGRWRPAL